MDLSTDNIPVKWENEDASDTVAPEPSERKMDLSTDSIPDEPEIAPDIDDMSVGDSGEGFTPDPSEPSLIQKVIGEPSWENMWGTTKRTAGAVLGLANAPLAFGWGGAVRQHEIPEKWKEMPWYQKLMESFKSAGKSAYSAITKEGEWGTMFGEYYKEAHDGKTIEDNLPDRLKYFAPAVETMANMISDPTLVVSGAASLIRRGVKDPLTKLPKGMEADQGWKEFDKLKDLEATDRAIVEKQLFDILDERTKYRGWVEDQQKMWGDLLEKGQVTGREEIAAESAAKSLTDEAVSLQGKFQNQRVLNEAIEKPVDRYKRITQSITDPVHNAEINSLLEDEMLKGFNVADKKVAPLIIKKLESKGTRYVREVADGENLGGLNAHFDNVHADADEMARKVWGEVYVREVEKYGGIATKGQGDEWVTIWPNYTTEQVKRIRANIDKQIVSKIEELGLAKVKHPKHNNLETGALEIHSGYSQWSPENPMHQGDMNRLAEAESKLRSEKKLLTKKKEAGIVDETKEVPDVERKRTQKAGDKPEPVTRTGVEGAGEEVGGKSRGTEGGTGGSGTSQATQPVKLKSYTTQKTGPSIPTEKALKIKASTLNKDYNKFLKRGKESRPLTAVLDDVNTAFGSAGLSIEDVTKTAERNAAKARLKTDLAGVADEAAEAGMGVKDWLVKNGASAEFAEAAARTLGRAEKVAAKAKPVAKETLKKDSELSKYAGSVNLERQDISDTAKRLEQNMFDEHGKKTVQSHKETQAKAEQFLKDFDENPEKFAQSVEDMKTRTLSIEEEHAHRIINADRFDNMTQASKDLNAGKITQKEFDKIFEATREGFVEVTDAAATQAGRRLDMYNMMAGRHRAMKAMSKLEKPLNKRQRTDLSKVDWDNPKSVEDFISRLPDPKLMDYVYEWWYNSILSGVPTQIVNVASNTGHMLFQAPHRALTGAVDLPISMFRGGKRDRYMNEMIPMFAGMKRGAQRAGRIAKEKIKKTVAGLKKQEYKSPYENQIHFDDKWSTEMGRVYEAFSRSDNKFVRGIGKAITPPTKALQAMDVMAKSIGYDAQIAALARRASNKAKLKGVNRSKFERNFIENPPPAAHDDAMAFADYVTFMEKPGWVGETAMKVRDTAPFGKFVIPFVRTVGNLMKRGVEMTPGLGLTLTKGQAPAEVAAKQIEGLVIAGYTYNKFKNGEITGAAPTNKAEKERFYAQGKKPWAVKFGDTWVEYRRIEPFNTVIATSVTLFEQLEKVDEDSKEAMDIMMGVANGLKENLLDGSYLSGLSRLLGRGEARKGWEKKFAATMSPYSSFFGSMDRAFDVLNEGKTYYKKPDTWRGAFSRVIPGLEDDTPAELDVWGEKINIEGGVLRQWLPYKWSKETNDPVEKELQRLDVFIGQPTQKTSTYEFNDRNYRNFLISTGVKTKSKMKELIGGRTASSKYYLSQSPEKKKKIIESQVSKIRNAERNRAKRKQGKSL